MRSLALLLPIAALGCGPGSSGSTTTGPAEPQTAPATPAEPPASTRVELGRCASKPVPFVSGLRARAPRAGAFSTLTGGKLKSLPKTTIGKASATGDLDKNIIRRYIRRELPKLQMCYERQLLVNPQLAGTVVSQFTIKPGGAVRDVAAKGLGPKVDNCVAQVIRRIQFPKPKGGGMVRVRYPFVFRAASGSTPKPKASKPAVYPGKVAAGGKVDRNMIRRSIRQALSRIRYCYEKRLAVDPSLSGTSVARFTIDASGAVSASSAKGFDPAIDRCIAGVIQSLRFPKPAGGGKVRVRYPFVFHSSPPSPPAKPTTGAEAKKEVIERARAAGVLGALASKAIATFETPLGSARPAIERCAARSGKPDALVVDFDKADPPKAHSAAGNRELERCVAEAVASVEAEGRCPIAVGADRDASPVRLALDRGAVQVAGESLGPLDRGAERQLTEALAAHRARIVAPGFNPPVARLDPLVLEVSAATRVGDLLRVLRLVESAGLHAVVAVREQGSVRQLRDAPLPWVPVPIKPAVMAPGEMRVIVGDGEIAVSASAIGQKQNAVFETPAALGSKLAEWKAKTSLDADTPIRIQVRPKQTFADLAAVIGALADQGLHRWELSLR